MPKAEKARSTASRVEPIARSRPSGRVDDLGLDGQIDQLFTPGLDEQHLPLMLGTMLAGAIPIGLLEDDEEDDDSGDYSGSEDEAPSEDESDSGASEMEDESDEGSESVSEEEVEQEAAAPNAFSTTAVTTGARSDQDSLGYLFRVMLRTMSAPNIVRVLRVPSTATFHQLHLILQTAFGWNNAHMYNFEVYTVPEKGQSKNRRFADQSEITRLEERPAYYDFLSASEREELKSSREVKLSQIFENEVWRAKGVCTEYTYDMGDNWDHILHYMGRADSSLGDAMGKLDQPAFCVAGEGRGCVEDCGSYPGYEELKQLFKDPSMPDGGRRQWYHDVTGDAKSLDPWAWDIVKVNKDLRKLCRLKAYTK